MELIVLPSLEPKYETKGWLPRGTVKCAVAPPVVSRGRAG